MAYLFRKQKFSREKKLIKSVFYVGNSTFSFRINSPPFFRSIKGYFFRRSVIGSRLLSPQFLLSLAACVLRRRVLVHVCNIWFIASQIRGGRKGRGGSGAENNVTDR